MNDGVIESVWISELGFLMIRIYYPNTKTYTRYNMGKIDRDLKLNNDFDKRGKK